MILVDTSVIVAWLDRTHDQHQKCWKGIRGCAARDRLAVSSVTFAELAAGARTLELLNEELSGFARVELDFPAAWRAGRAFRQFRSRANDSPVLPDFFIRGQAAVLGIPHLTNDRRRTAVWPDVDFIFLD